MFLMITVNHAFEQGSRLISKGTGIYMNQEKKGEHETHNVVQGNIEYHSGDVKYMVGDHVREQECNSRQDQ